MSVSGAAKIWSLVGTFVLLFSLGMFFASRSPSGGCLPLAKCVEAGNPDSTRYWGVLGCTLGVAVIAWAASAHGHRAAAQQVWWKRLPPLSALEDPQERSVLVATMGLVGFVVVPWISALAMGAVLWQAAIVRHGNGAPLPGTPWEARIAALRDSCPWGEYCFQLGDRNGIEYKPILSDVALVIAAALAAAMCIRLARVVLRRPGRAR